MKSLLLPASKCIPSTIELPGSKSISNRSLLLAAIADNSLRVQGCNGCFPKNQADLFLGNAGTAFRPLTAVLAIMGGNYYLHGTARMHERPIGDLVEVLHKAGASVSYQQEAGYPPLQILPRQTNAGQQDLTIKGNVSSQFLTALLMALPLTGIQGDIAFVNELIKIGAKVEWGQQYIEISRDVGQEILPFDIDANHIPDAAMTLAVVALACKQTCRIRNIASWRVKETDRIAAMATELRKLGAEVIETEDSITITAPERLQNNIHIHTYDDHRIAMCFSLVSLLGTSVYIDDPECVNKTFPDYFKVFASMCTPV